MVVLAAALAGIANELVGFACALAIHDEVVAGEMLVEGRDADGP